MYEVAAAVKIIRHNGKRNLGIWTLLSITKITGGYVRLHINHYILFGAWVENSA